MYRIISLFSFVILALPLQAAVVTYDSESALMADAGIFTTTYDFETTSGFPGTSYIGTVDGIHFDASTFSPTPFFPGSQSMTGAGTSILATRDTATLDFSTYGLQVTGFGFDGLDLFADEVIRVSVDFNLGGSQSFDVALNGASDNTPIYFGAIDTADRINQISFAGLDGSGAASAWHLDNLTLVTSPMVVPVPAALPLFLSGLALLGFWRRRT
ncbi:MAG: VPLPA-CTERM sorting domain-containing protein [Gammaproteobacteria bacterium]|nr:VPLPA-CTERM sorting domain-containing protein [Gammaproteobacteria bacterium]